MTDQRRVRALSAAGLVDSLGLAIGWTAFNIVAVLRDGLAATGELNAAMLCGVALAAPATAWVTRRLDGRRTLEAAAASEAVLRAASLAALFWNAPLPLVAGLVLVANVVAWTGYAAMKAEIAAADRHAASVTRYTAIIVAVEAVGAIVAAALPITAHGDVSARCIGLVILGYGLSLLPTAVVARRSPLPRHESAVRVRWMPTERRLLLGGAAASLLCCGPTLLYVAMATTLDGRTAVIGAALAFAVGSLLAPTAHRLTARWGLPPAALGAFWAAGMVVGWVAAPWAIAGLWLAQLLAGTCLTAFEGSMDGALAARAPVGASSAALARGSAARAMGGAGAVRLLPLFATPVALCAYSAGSAALCLLVGSVAVISLRRRSGRSAEPAAVVPAAEPAAEPAAHPIPA